MAALAFFLIGLPLALIANRVVVQLTDFEETQDEDDATSSRRLPWHRGLWPQRVRWFILALVASLVMPDADLAGAIGAALLIGSLFFVMALVTGGGMGIGDAKLVMLIGAMLGLPEAWQALVIGVLSAGLVILPFFL